MANTRIIKRRIKSAQNISQITKAMEMVAASKMKKAQEEAVMGKPYAQKIYEVTRQLAGKINRESHPLLTLGNITGKKLIVLISTNKGLCGGLNTNLFRTVQKFVGTDKTYDFVAVGKKSQNFIVRTGKNLTADFSATIPFTEIVPPLTQYLVQGFLNETYQEIYLVFNAFLSALRQIPVTKMILPISTLKTEDKVASDTDHFVEFLIEPSIDHVLDILLPHYLENQIRSSILEAEASEHSARMIAMKNATDAAFELTQELTLIYNKARQEKITNEIADIVTARLAVEV
ncbi:ATP synthase F1 subunit gamma [Candidatus Gottesmanbacteria bacterium RBG_13_37_7]|uniref:ATP synthase gamma chain n=1 Tax=Candidatus Gottesmanbacteria bacterium RBG_13_37_7 TaxID=1798369 RepID=A0A1F5YI84_9BACT|nr:MAG: ATP synthase F1 subunit gamma [Candidatus Gottesmanbacteria bacterium RBG_13_37_7]